MYLIIIGISSAVLIYVLMSFKQKKSQDEMMLNLLIKDIYKNGVSYFDEFMIIGREDYAAKSEVINDIVDVYFEDELVLSGYIMEIKNKELFISIIVNRQKVVYKLVGSKILSI